AASLLGTTGLVESPPARVRRKSPDHELGSAGGLVRLLVKRRLWISVGDDTWMLAVMTMAPFAERPSCTARARARTPICASLCVIWRDTRLTRVWHTCQAAHRIRRDSECQLGSSTISRTLPTVAGG